MSTGQFPKRREDAEAAERRRLEAFAARDRLGLPDPYEDGRETRERRNARLSRRLSKK